MAEPADTFQEEQRAAYLGPESVDEALALLAEHGEDAKLVAGGQSLLVFLRNGLLAPRYLIGLKQIPELTRIEPMPDGWLAIGAMVTQHRLATDPEIVEQFPGARRVRRRGRVAPNPAARHHRRQSLPRRPDRRSPGGVDRARRGGRDRLGDVREPADAGRGALRRLHGNVTRAGRAAGRGPYPARGERSGAAYLKHRLRGVDTALVGAGVGLALAEDGMCHDARIGLVGAGTTPIRGGQRRSGTARAGGHA